MAEFFTIGQRLILEFDIPMLQIPIDGGDMFFRINNTERTLTFSAWNSPTRVTFTSALVGADMGADIVSFTGSPMTFLSTESIPAEGFTNFPVV